MMRSGIALVVLAIQARAADYVFMPDGCENDAWIITDQTSCQAAAVWLGMPSGTTANMHSSDGKMNMYLQLC